MYPLRKLSLFLRHARVRRATAHEYEQRYEQLAQNHTSDDAVGAGEYELIGRIELEMLLMQGLQASHTLVDFGCGNGRLAMHAVPALARGRYIGTDISPTLLQRAEERICAKVASPSCQVSWRHQHSARFPIPSHSADMMCAFSVFTHIEHEDTYHYLCDARRVVRPGGRLVFSCLPLNTALGRQILLSEAATVLAARGTRVRNVATSMDMMSDLARMAGWHVLRWYAGDEKNIGLPGGEMRALGQSCCVLEAPVG